MTRAAISSVPLWLNGLGDSFRQMAGAGGGPQGQSGGLLSPFLETLRVGHVSRWIEGKRVLDCGCGRGKLLAFLPSDALYLGVDRDRGLVDYLTRVQGTRSRRFMCADLEYLSFPEPFVCDTVVLTAVLEHLRRPGQVLRDVSSHLRPGGVVVLTTPHPGFSWLLDATARLGVLDRRAQKEHGRLLDRAMLEVLLAHAGLELERYYCFLLGMNQLGVARKPAVDATTLPHKT